MRAALAWKLAADLSPEEVAYILGHVLMGSEMCCNVTVSTMDGSKYNVLMDPTASVEVLKQSIESASGIPVHEQQLFVSDQEDQLLLTADLTTLLPISTMYLLQGQR